jgi:hypothetical protein
LRKTHLYYTSRQGRAGQPEAALRVLDDALALVGKTEERFDEATLIRLQGELMLQLPNTDSPPWLAPCSARGVTASSDGPNRHPTWSIRGVRRTMPQACDRRAQYRMYSKQHS